ncbi:MAG: recombinase family protein [Campylobacterota bacterium]|nr:recombinase family protein [Campylobacterota bacterium]
MDKVVSFIRVNKNNSTYTNNQIVGIAEYIKQNNLKLDKSIEIEVNIPNEEVHITNILNSCKKDCTVLVYNINIFGRTISSILTNIKSLLNHNIRVISVKQNIDFISKDDMLTQMILGVISMTIDLEKELMSLRTKEALTAKKLDGISLGKPKGTIQKSKFDQQRDKIEELLRVGLSVRKISKLLGYNNHIGLNNYVKKRNIRENLLLDGSTLAS